MNNCDNQVNETAAESVVDISKTEEIHQNAVEHQELPTEKKSLLNGNVSDAESDVDDAQTFVDLSAVKAANEVIEQTLALEEDYIANAESNDTYNSIMTVCSTTAQEIRNTISEVLNSRERITITEIDETNNLEECLNKKIADFESVVNSCFPSQTESTSKLVEQNETNSDEISKQADHCEEQNKNLDSEIPSTALELQNVTATIDHSLPVQETDQKLVIQEKENKPIQPEMLLKDAGKHMASTLGEEDKSLKKQQKSYSNKKKGGKTIDQVLKSLSSHSTPDQKLQVLCKKHVETLEELRLVEPRLKQLERQVITQQREKEQLQADHNRMILAKSRLESLCRELQRQSKLNKEESLLRIRIREEEEKRKEVANKFQSTLNDISSLMQENSKKNIQLREENCELAKKLKSLVDHYEMWEKHMEKVVQQKELEAQLSKAKHAKINLLLKQETEKFLREKQALLENMSELQKRCTVLTSNELQLRTELGDYSSKYEEFQTVLNKSSQVFASFTNDMEATSKKIKKLEKETNVYKKKWENSNTALLGMISDKEKHDKDLTNAHNKIITLEKLCRALQAERNDLQNQLNTVSAGSPTEKVPTETAVS